jgi:hypothetical protein
MSYVFDPLGGRQTLPVGTIYGLGFSYRPFGSRPRWRFDTRRCSRKGPQSSAASAPSAPNSPAARISPKLAAPVAVYITALARPPSTSRAWPIPAIPNEPSEKIA